jgi:hypothetical protein
MEHLGLVPAGIDHVELERPLYGGIGIKNMIAANLQGDVWKTCQPDDKVLSIFSEEIFPQIRQREAEFA